MPARFLLAGVFGVAGLLKIDDPAASVRAVRAYDLLPDWLAVAVGRGLPAFELALAVALVLGVALRLTAGVAAGLLAVFIVGISSAWARGMQIDCGCFGGGGVTDDPQYGREIARDVALLVVAVALAMFGRSRLTVGQRLAPGVVAAALLLAGGAGIVVAEATEPAAPTRVPAGVTEAGGIVVGSPDAPRTVVVYEDPQCPHCADFERIGGVALQAAVDAGEVKVEYRMRSFLGPDSVRAVAALGAAQDAGKFDELRAAMFAHLLSRGGYSVEQLLVLGASVGLTDETFVDAVRDQVYAPWARAVDDRASKDGNTGTPALFLDGHPVDPALLFDARALATALQA